VVQVKYSYLKIESSKPGDTNVIVKNMRFSVYSSNYRICYEKWTFGIFYKFAPLKGSKIKPSSKIIINLSSYNIFGEIHGIIEKTKYIIIGKIFRLKVWKFWSYIKGWHVGYLQIRLLKSMLN